MTRAITPADFQMTRNGRGGTEVYGNNAVQASMYVLNRAREIWQRYKTTEVEQRSLEYFQYDLVGTETYTRLNEILAPRITWETWLREAQDRGGVEGVRLKLLILGALYVLLPSSHRIWILRAMALAPHLIYAGNLQRLVDPYIVSEEQIAAHDVYPYEEEREGEDDE